MSFREVNEDDILKEQLKTREEGLLGYLTGDDNKHHIYFDEISERILKNVPKQNKEYVKKLLNKLDENFLDYLGYWNEKYYRNGFVDGARIVMGCLDK